MKKQQPEPTQTNDKRKMSKVYRPAPRWFTWNKATSRSRPLPAFDKYDEHVKEQSQQTMFPKLFATAVNVSLHHQSQGALCQQEFSVLIRRCLAVPQGAALNSLPKYRSQTSFVKPASSMKVYIFYNSLLQASTNFYMSLQFSKQCFTSLQKYSDSFLNLYMSRKKCTSPELYLTFV